MNLDIESRNVRNELEDQDCAVCLQKYHYPTQLPCGHVFCFLCVKGIAIQSKKCAMCRKQIPLDYLDHPVLLENPVSQQISASCNNEEYQWYYEGRNGWWKYDERSNIELESAFNTGETECMLLLAGALYCVDFQNMLQFRRSDPTRRRRVKRDVPSLPSKGVAGIKKIEHIQEQQEVTEENENLVQEVTEQTDEMENVGSQDENNPSIDVNNVIQSLSDMRIENANDPQTSPEEEET
ncbi:E3 ubiquitin-protein ligase rnf146-like [Epargyreus clarus]|uniref:E3 ubiquitin-protein ligase rnf146-like n=1 Tax=Epargyreus clarus TaxID=520877 RepID=UPI003C2F43F0